jgi:hypothetical protein
MTSDDSTTLNSLVSMIKYKKELANSRSGNDSVNMRNSKELVYSGTSN